MDFKNYLSCTGSAEPNIRIASCGYLIEVKNKKILIDWSGDVFRRLMKYGLYPQDLLTLFLVIFIQTIWWTILDLFKL